MATYNYPKQNIKTVDAIDHHRKDKSLRSIYLGVMEVGGGVELVCIGMPGYMGHLSINEVYVGDEGKWHLSTRSVWSLYPDQLEELYRQGELHCAGNELTPARAIRALRPNDDIPGFEAEKISKKDELLREYVDAANRPIEIPRDGEYVDKLDSVLRTVKARNNKMDRIFSVLCRAAQLIKDD